MEIKKLFLLLFLFISISSFCQELYVYTEPASNMPAKTVGLKFTGRIPQTGSYKGRLIPEAMIGVNKNLMFHVSTTFSNYYTDNTRFESGKLYAKYRFLSVDDVHSHFRMAAFADVSLTRSPYVYEEVTLEGDNSGAQFGLIATQLINKLAVSGTASYTRVFDTQEKALHHAPDAFDFINYSLSAGYLVLPKEYVDYKQTNMNIYLEMLGMRSIDNRHYGVDLAPAIQFIFNSNSKVNIGYRFQVAGNMSRIAQRQWQVAFEHTLFNILK